MPSLLTPKELTGKVSVCVRKGGKGGNGQEEMT
jgi:hypothetical protein